MISLFWIHSIVALVREHHHNRLTRREGKICSSKVKKTIEACRDTGYLERDAFERAIPVSIPLEEKKKRKIRTIIKTYTRPSRHEFISSKQLNMPLLGAYEFVITGAPVVACVSAIFTCCKSAVVRVWIVRSFIRGKNLCFEKTHDKKKKDGKPKNPGSLTKKILWTHRVENTLKLFDA